MDNVYKRGSIWMFNRPKSECLTSGTHPCIIVSNDEWNKISSVLTIVPCTSKPLKGTATHLVLENLNKLTYVFPGQITTVHKSDIHSYLGELSKEQLIELDKALAPMLGLSDTPINHYVRLQREIEHMPERKPEYMTEREMLVKSTNTHKRVCVTKYPGLKGYYTPADE